MMIDKHRRFRVNTFDGIEVIDDWENVLQYRRQRW
jgi:hypothetical protein